VRVLGINAVFHDPAAALVVDGRTVAAAEEERFSRRKHGKACVPFSTWELPEQAIAWCLERGGVAPGALDAIGYSYDPALAPAAGDDITADEWEGLRTLYVRRAPLFLRSLGLDPGKVRFVGHHLAHAASCHLAAPFASSAVLVVDGRGESASHLAGHAHPDGSLDVLAAQRLPHSLGLLYEELTAHLGFRRSSDEYKVMAMASYGEPRFLDELRELVAATRDGGFRTARVDWERYAPRSTGGEDFTADHADLARSVQERLEEVLLDLARWLHERTGERRLTMAGGVALNCVANSRLWREGPFDDVWVQPAAGDSGTALGAALRLAHELGDRVEPMRGASLGREWSDAELAARLDLDGRALGRLRSGVDELLRLLDRHVAQRRRRNDRRVRGLAVLGHSGTACLERVRHRLDVARVFERLQRRLDGSAMLRVPERSLVGVEDDRARVRELLRERASHHVERGRGVGARHRCPVRVLRAGSVACEADADQHHQPHADHERAPACGEDRYAVQ
jgi:carbamoyltransferase